MFIALTYNYTRGRPHSDGHLPESCHPDGLALVLGEHQIVPYDEKWHAHLLNLEGVI